jgi:hypothetical protein
MNLVTIATFDSVEEAHLAKNRLADEGVPSFIEEAAMTGLLPHNAAFETKLQVAQDWVDRARHILKDVDKDKFND